MQTEHRCFFTDARNIDDIASESVDLVVTSPPYPMIQMWDDVFCTMDPSVKNHLKKGRGIDAFNRMHDTLLPVWEHVFRVLKPGRFACINIGDATRTLAGDFAIYPNHARLLNDLIKTGFTPLPCIIWRKQTNAPNKYMGSGMLPAGAYVTLEHEYIIIVRKGAKREFKTNEEKTNRQQSALFWEERNQFFSDIWFDIKGNRQKLGQKKTRDRSGAFPFELAFRLISMYSVKQDLVFDPFLGTGTTMAAAMAAARSSLGCELDRALKPLIHGISDHIQALADDTINSRLDRHVQFVEDRKAAAKPLKYENRFYGFPVVTRQETELFFNRIEQVKTDTDGTSCVTYEKTAGPAESSTAGSLTQPGTKKRTSAARQLQLPF